MKVCKRFSVFIKTGKGDTLWEGQTLEVLSHRVMGQWVQQEGWENCLEEKNGSVINHQIKSKGFVNPV